MRFFPSSDPDEKWRPKTPIEVAKDDVSHLKFLIHEMPKNISDLEERLMRMKLDLTLLPEKLKVAEDRLARMKDSSRATQSKETKEQRLNDIRHQIQHLEHKLTKL
jgi:predicted  nucleic acid-binding Zn-ribbon protein